MSQHKKVKASKAWADGPRGRVWSWCIKCDAASYDAMVLRDACVIHGARIGMKDPQKSQHFCGNDVTCAEAALKAKGITRPKETKA